MYRLRARLAAGCSVVPTRVGMYRAPRTIPTSSPGWSPHAWGCTALVQQVSEAPPAWSPHAWGCTADETARAAVLAVVPTRVGMYRTHTQYADRCAVVPTRVGMYRVMSYSRATAMRGPHTRGDVPPLSAVGGCRVLVVPTRVGMYRFMPRRAGALYPWSPHAWGCTDTSDARNDTGGVVPTRVGMYRCTTRTTPGPTVVPTRVGMYRSPRRRAMPVGSGPHTRGDVPNGGGTGRGASSWSPHAWGCTGYATGFPAGGGVVPTRVGMYRAGEAGTGHTRRGPHTRGDVPVTAASAGYLLTVVPTRVGMYRPDRRVCVGR